jgi:hypothetical protein
MAPEDYETALFPDPGTRQRLERQLTQALEEARSRISEGSVTPTLDFAAFRSKLSDCDFRSPKAMDDLLCWTIAQLEHGIVHVTHPRYFGLFNPMPTFPSECADRIVAALNPQLATSTTSPVPVEIEAHVIRRESLDTLPRAVRKRISLRFFAH